MIYSFVPISGPKQSIAGPINPFLASSIVYLLVILSSSAYEYLVGLILTPPLAPPNGIPAMVSLKVIKEASAIDSCKSMCSEYLVPPLTGK